MVIRKGSILPENLIFYDDGLGGGGGGRVRHVQIIKNFNPCPAE